MAGIAMVVAAALSLVVFVSLANVVTMVFTRNAVRAAVDEAVRVGSRSDGPIADCETRARAVLDGLLGPAARRDVGVTCTASGSPLQVRARADVTIVPWLPGLPRWSYTVESAEVREALP
ncbi:MAG: hypothetical protein WDA60_08195 [Acidimicrobiia bacterium]|jgi:hypothetical protein